jgi:hypothetical protein
MALHLGHRQLAKGFQPISSPVLGVPTTVPAIPTIQGLEVVEVLELAALEQTAILAITLPNSSWNS